MWVVGSVMRVHEQQRDRRRRREARRREAQAHLVAEMSRPARCRERFLASLLVLLAEAFQRLTRNYSARHHVYSAAPRLGAVAGAQTPVVAAAAAGAVRGC